MDRATIERIFDPFFTTKPQGVGTGLGLSVVHGIVKSHDGAITVYSEPARGTSFRLYFPAVETAAGRSSAAVARGRGAHVLLVDDEPPLAALAAKILERAGYRVTAMSDAANALAEFGAHPDRYDAIVTDLAMSGMSGFDLARNALAARPDVPVVVASGLLRAEDQRIAAEIGVRALVRKPESIEELGGVLARILRRHGDGAGAAAQTVAARLR
jgi:CheY-like chemotaxis protein